MKKSSRILTVVLAALITAIIAVFAVSASDPDGGELKDPVIKYCNLAFEEKVNVLYAVEYDGGIPSSDADFGVLVWHISTDKDGNKKAIPASFTHQTGYTANLKSVGTQTIGGVKYPVFEFDRIAAKQMTDEIYAVAYVKYAGDTEYRYSDVHKYSVVQYAVSMAESSKNADLVNLVNAMREYGAAAQKYFNYRTDRLATDSFAFVNLKDATFSDGTTRKFFKEGDTVSGIIDCSTPFLQGSKTQLYVSTASGIGIFYGGDSITVPAETCTVTPKVVISDENFDSLKVGSLWSSSGIFYANNKGESRYYVTDDGNGGKYIKHYKASGTGNDSQVDSNYNTCDIMDYLYDCTSGLYADKKLTVSLKLARTDKNVATAAFNLRHYEDCTTANNRVVDYTTTVFNLDASGNVLLGNSVQVGSLSEDWQEYSFVVDFGAGDKDNENNLFAYRNGFLVGATRVEAFNTRNFLVYTSESKARECVVVNFHTGGNDEGELLFDDIRLTVGETPVCEKSQGLINYTLNGGKLPSSAKLTYVPGETVTLPTPTKDNYDFGGWYTTATFDEGTKVDSLLLNDKKVVNLYAKFTATSDYLEELRRTNASFAGKFDQVNTSNQYNDAENGVADKYPLVGYGQEVFYSSIITMDTEKYEPAATPSGRTHPYVFFSRSDLDQIIKTFNSDEFAAARVQFWNYANTANFTGEFPEREGVEYRFSTSILAQMEAKALAYLITGDPVYGYEAIIGAKNAMLTLNYTKDIHMDPYHGASQTMLTVAKVYDWCYDLMTEQDKTDIILGVQNRMCPALEYNLFQKEQGLANSNPVPSAVAGHGTGPQFIRDYVTVALAFYTEETSWWDFIGGRFIAEYAPVIEYAYNGGWASQGMACYGTAKYFINMWAAWVIRSATGYTVSYAVDDGGSGREAAYFLNSHIMANDRYFQTGDGGRTPNGSDINIEYMVLAAAFYSDPALEAFAKYYTSNYSKFSYDFNEELTVPMTIVFGSFFAQDVEEGEYENRGDGVDLIQYFGSPNGFMSARDSWESDAAVVMMKIGEMTMANHDIGDHGTFQIYYKGMLATTSGAYKKYGSNAHLYYLQATVAQNGLLIFNPALSGDDISKPASYYYSGSQRQFSSGNTIEEWLSGSCVTGTVNGYEAGYNSDGSAKYGYIAGEITQAYNGATVDYVGRRMLTVYTGNPDYPMLFLTFDEITSDGADFTKTFLLHTVNEPTVDEDGMSATVTDGDGKLVLHSLFGASKIEKIGGEGKAYWINGRNCVDQYAPDDDWENIWGRIELSTSGNLSDSFLTAMYVTDATKDVSAAANVKGYESDELKFAVMFDYVLAFVDSHERIGDEFKLGVQGTGLYNYYISGIAAGTWNVSVDGTHAATFTVSEEGGIATFVAPAGKVTVTPTDDVTAGESGRIDYQTGGGALPAGTSTTYSLTQATPLDAVPTRGNDEFLGWFISADCKDDELITEIPAGLGGGTVTVYAKWRKVLIKEDYESTNVSVPESTTKTFGGIIYNAGSASEKKPGSTHYTETGADGNKYLKVTASGKNSCIIYASDSYNLTSFMETAISYEFDVAKLAGTPLANVSCIIATSGSTYGTLSNLFNITSDSSGNVTVKIGGQTVSGITISESFTTIRMTVDFAASTVSLYSADGKVIKSVGISVPKISVDNNQVDSAPSLAEWQKVAKNCLFRLEVTKSAAGDNCAVLLDNIRVIEGRASEKKTYTESDNFVVLMTNGGKLKNSAISAYSKSSATPLPTEIVNGDKVFGGWYTSPTFEEGTRVKEIASGTTGIVTVYAKWTAPLHFEDFESTAVDVFESSKTAGSYTYNANNSGCSLRTEYDASGNSYIVAKNQVSEKGGNTNGLLYSQSENYNLTDFTETAVSFELKLKKAKGVKLSAVGVDIPSSGGKFGALRVFNVGTDGNIKLNGSSTVIGTVGEDRFTTVRVTVDFAAGTIYAYDAAGNVLASVKPSVPTVPSSSGVSQPTTLADWQKIVTNYLFYLSYSPNAVTEDSPSCILIDDIKIIEGRAF